MLYEVITHPPPPRLTDVPGHEHLVPTGLPGVSDGGLVDLPEPWIGVVLIESTAARAECVRQEDA